MKITNNHNLPLGIVRAIERDPYDNENSDLTASSLSNPPLLETLKRRYWDMLTEDASDRIWALFGQAVHAIAERGAKTELVTAEKRYFATVLGWKISGAIDHHDDGLLSDYKVTSAWTLVYGDRLEDWEKQLNALAWLVDQTEGAGTIRSLEIVAILRDWAEREVERVRKYPASPVVVIPLKLWPVEKRRAYIEERVRLHQKSRIQNLFIACTDEERWMKKDRKTGVKTFVRCERYCACRPVCPVLEAEALDEPVQQPLLA